MEIESTLAAALPGYEIGGELGRGAYGVVLAGRHRQLGREVAIKQLSPGLVTDGSVRSRFLAEAQVLASIDHPHIVPVYDYVEHDDACILVMERLAGGTVWNRFVNRGFDQPTACAIALVACSGLSSAHSHGVLHRDMKPENVLFGEDMVLKVTDFGIARVLGDDDTLATREGEILGTPAYMAPEQASGADLGPTTDVYATGVMLYELLSGRLPYPEEGGSLAIVMRHMNEDAVPLADVAPEVPSHLSDVVMRALARDPADRFESAEAFGVAIGQAASASWGRGWLGRSGIALREPGPILEGAQHATAMGTGGRDGAVVRPVIDLHAGGADASDLVLGDLMPLRRAPVEVPEFPTRLAWAAVGVAVIALVLGLLGVGSSSPTPVLGAGLVTVAGHDPAVGGRVPINLDHQIPVTLRNLPSAAGTPRTAQLVLSLGGLSVVRSTPVPLVRGPTGLHTTLDASSGRYVVGGKLAATLRISGSQEIVNDNFGVTVSRSPFSSFGGVVGIVLLLFVVAYAESLLRSLRRGRRRDNRTAAVAGLVVVGVVGGLAATLWGWMLGIAGPTFVPLIVSAVLGAIAGLLAGLCGMQVGRGLAPDAKPIGWSWWHGVRLCHRPILHQSGSVAEVRIRAKRGARAARTFRWAALAILTVLATVGLGAPVAQASVSGVSFTAVVNGQPVDTSSDAHPAQIYPARFAEVQVTVSNNSTSTVRISSVRLEGEVLNLPIFSYDTAVELVVPPGAMRSLGFPISMSGVGSQATGLVVGTIALFAPNGSVVASQPLVSNVHGSLNSLYGLFGLAVLVLTVSSLATALLAMARHTLSQNRWMRGIRFFIPGFGIGLVLTFTLSAFRVFTAGPGHWLPLLIVTSVGGFAIGYLTPAPNEEEFDDYDDDVLLAQIIVVDEDPLESEDGSGGLVMAAAPGAPDGRTTAAPGAPDSRATAAPGAPDSRPTGSPGSS